MEAKQKSKGWCWWLLVFVYAALVVAMAILTLWRNFGGSDSKAAHVPGPPGTIVDKYSGGLSIAMQFFDVQKSGELVNNRIAWRGDSGLEDGSEENLDLSKGMYDAGDLMKFGFPMAFTATVLSWAILEYGDQMKAVKELEHAQDSLKWITDYLINAHPSTNLLYIQVGDPELDHNCWERPEVMTERRPLTQVNATYPGSDIAAETAAAMASSSLVFKTVNSTYSKLLLKHAQQLFAFADTYRGSYSISIPRVQKYYNSTGYGDELLWAASWLYHATGDQLYLRYVTTQNGQAFANWGSPSWFSWDNKLAGTQVLLSRVNFFGAKEISTEDNLALQMYRKTAEAVMCTLLPDSPTATPQRTEGGLIWVSQWNVLQYTVASSFLALLYSDYMLRSQTSTLYCNGKLYNPMDLRNFAILQLIAQVGPLEFVPFTSTADSTGNLGSIMALSSLFYILGSNFKEDSLADYVLGNNPFKMSYLVGYGSNYPQYIHHRGASIPVDANTGCRDGFKWLNSTDPNPNLAVGALVGGPFLNETYIDSRNNSMQGEPTTYNSAFVVGLLSGLLTTSSVVLSFA